MNRLRTLWQNLNASLWFVPTLMVAGAGLLAFGLVIAESRMNYDGLRNYPCYLELAPTVRGEC